MCCFVEYVIILWNSTFATQVVFLHTIKESLSTSWICSLCSVSMQMKHYVQFEFQHKGWRMVKSETRRDAEILVRNPSPRLFGKKLRDSKKVKTNHAETILRDLSKTPPRFRDPAKIFRDPRFSRYHSPPLISGPEQSMKIDDRKINRSIDDNRLITVD